MQMGSVALAMGIAFFVTGLLGLYNGDTYTPRDLVLRGVVFFAIAAVVGGFNVCREVWREGGK